MNACMHFCSSIGFRTQAHRVSYSVLAAVTTSVIKPLSLFVCALHNMDCLCIERVLHWSMLEIKDSKPV